METADNQINAKTARARILVLPNLDSAFKEKITNPQVLGTVDDDSNFVVAKIHLK